MLNEQELNKLAQMIPAKAPFAVIASWNDAEETADEWDDHEHVHFCRDWVEACDTKRAVESECGGDLMAYIIEPAQPLGDDNED